jgi:hypothetical protein
MLVALLIPLSSIRCEGLCYDGVDGQECVYFVFGGEVVSFPDIVPHKNVWLWTRQH